MKTSLRKLKKFRPLIIVLCAMLCIAQRKNRFRLLEGTLQNQNVKYIFDIKKSNEYNFQCRFNCMSVLGITGSVPSIFNSL